MEYIVANVLAILAAALAGIGVGALFHLALRRAGRVSPGLMAVAFIAEFWLAAILAGALILAPSGAGAWTMAIGSAVVIWIGFVLPVLVVTQSYRGAGKRTVAIDCAHWLAVMVAQAVVLQSIGLTAPVA